MGIYRLYQTVVALVYPAVLGTFLFTLPADLFANTSRQWLWDKFLLLMLFIHYVMDFLYTIIDGNSAAVQDEYSLKRGILDLLIVGCLYSAFNIAAGNRPFVAFEIRWVWWAMSFMKACATAWELLPLKDWRKPLIDGCLCIVYLVLGLAAEDSLFLMVAVLFVDILFYIPFLGK